MSCPCIWSGLTYINYVQLSTKRVLFFPHLQIFVHIIFLEGPKVIFCSVSQHVQLCLLMVIVEYIISSNFRSLLSLSSCHPDVFLERTVEWVSDLYFFTVVPSFYYQLVSVSVDV